VDVWCTPHVHPDDAWWRVIARDYATHAQVDGPAGYMTDLDNGITEGCDWYAISGGRLVLVHEGGYSEAYVPFCGHAVIEELSGRRTKVVDPLLEFIGLQQPTGPTADFLRDLVDSQASAFDAHPVPS